MEEIIKTQVVVIPFTNRELKQATRKIFKISETVRRCAFETAFIMARVDDSECYKDDGFNSVHEWAMKTFGFKKSASYSLLRVGKEYTRAISDAKGNVKGYGSNLIRENAENDFSTTQIEKMLPGGHELAVELVENEEITPDMTCKEIEKVIKAYTKPEKDEPETDTEPEKDEPETDTEPEKDEPETDTEPEKTITVTDEDGNEYAIPEGILKKYRI